jgi:hypothetical protein
VVCLAPRALGDSVRPRRLVGASVRPLSFTVRGPIVTPYQCVALALRLFAVWLALQALGMLPSFFAPRAFESPNFVWMSFLLAITAAVIVVLWVFPRAIAGKLLPPPDTEQRASATPDLWLAMGCTLLGLWTLITVLPRLLFDLYAMSSTPTFEDASALRVGVLYGAFRLAIGLWLVLGAKGVRKLFWWAQNAGIRKDL